MRVQDRHYRTVWLEMDNGDWSVGIIDQTRLPFSFELTRLERCEQVADAIRHMLVRGAGCIGATAGYGMVLAVREAAKESGWSGGAGSHAFRKRLGEKARMLNATRPTAVNLNWAIRRQLSAVDRSLAAATEPDAVLEMVRSEAEAIADEDAAACQSIGEHGLVLIQEIHKIKPDGDPVRILTHCNAGWLAFVDYGSATAPIYAAHRAAIPIHVWVDETRPRNQGASLTAWELAGEGVSHSVITDNAGGHLMQRGLVDLVLTGTDRTARSGDVANKIGTYLKALAARDNRVPFYVALPSSSIDWEIENGLEEIPIEERDTEEVTQFTGWCDRTERTENVRTTPAGSGAANPAFDVTPARLITGLITECGLCEASEKGLRGLGLDHPCATDSAIAVGD